MNEPKVGTIDRAIQALKLSVAKRTKVHPFWQPRYYDFNVWNPEKTTEKLRYMHRNPVHRGLVANPEDWVWSSFRQYKTGCEGAVEIESFWTAAKRANQLPEFI
jgi:putative transposase